MGFASALRPDVPSFGYATVLSINAASIWGGVSPYLPDLCRSADVTALFYLVQMVAFLLMFCAAGAMTWRSSRWARKVHVAAFSAPLMTGPLMLIAAMYVEELALAFVVAAAVLVWFVTTEPVRHPRQDVGGEAGVLQDGAYYVFAGSGFPGPDEARVPQGIFRYVPGEGKEQLVSYQAHRMDVLFSCWGVNTHGLYYVDIDTNALWRQDLTTGEETLLYTAPGPEEPEAELGVGDLWNYFAHGEELELTYDVALFLNQVGEDTVTLTYRYPDGKTTDTVVLDSRTGALLSQTAQRENGYPLWLGERCIEVVYVDHPEGFTYPGWEEDVELNQYHWTDLQEDGRSLLPPGTMGAGEQAAIEIPGGLLIGYASKNRFDEAGNYLRDATGYLLLTPAGRDYILPEPEDPEDSTRDYLAVADGWLYFTNRTWAALDNGGRRQEWSLWARQLETGEEVLVQNECGPLRLITDGTWCYLSDGNTTDCYRLEHDGQGRPCGLTLVEETI